MQLPRAVIETISFPLMEVIDDDDDVDDDDGDDDDDLYIIGAVCVSVSKSHSCAGCKYIGHCCSILLSSGHLKSV